jgi:rRNA-processing protein FCF1
MPNLPPAVLPDTNYLLEHPYLHKENWKLSSLEILISETVTSELRGLTGNPDLEVARKARVALGEINKYQGPLAD